MRIIRKNIFIFSSMYRIEKYFDWSLRLLIVFLPFYTILSVFFSQKVGIPGISFLKEILIFLMLATLVLAHISGYKKILWSRYDVALFFYIGIMILITIFTTGLVWMVYGGKYDFSFLIIFFILYHGRSFLSEPIAYYLKLFLISGGIMLIISMLLKWPFSEDLLRYVGYSGNPSNWQFGWPPTIFHGVDGANVRRFQWILDGPNTMGAYILIYMGVLAYYFRNYKDWYFVIWGWLLGLAVFLFYTYSRSAIIWLILGLSIIILFLLPKIYKKYKKQFLALTFLTVFVIGGIFFQYSGNMAALITRGWSTNWHAERMKIGMERFLENPFWHWLWSAGPAYRYLENLALKPRSEIEELDKKYIPESWYIQQLIEWGIFWFLAFSSLMGLILYGLWPRYIIILGMFTAILTMNLFLHTFESSHVALTLFLILGLFLAPIEKPHAKT